MKKILLLVMGVVMLMSVNAVAQNVGAIMLYTDPAGTTCNLTTDPAVPVTVYVFHSFHTGVSASRFMIENKGTNWLYLFESPQGGAQPIGDTNAGASFAYPSCQASDYNFVNVTYQAVGAAGVCSSLEVVPDPASLSGTIEATDCSFPFPLKFTADGSNLTVNCPDLPLQCGRIVPVESTSWGRVKALYN